jgi:hypothetical protein
VHVDLPDEGSHDADLDAQARDQTDAQLRLRLWPDDVLHAMRQRSNDYSEGAELSERIVLSVANVGTAPREVWLEEKLRPARRHALERTFPGKAVAEHDVVRAHVTVLPGKVEHVGFTVAYEF